MLLEVRNLDVYYGAVHALKGVSVTVRQGEIVTLIGANGAGKTTLLRTISGLVPARSGAIRYEGKDLRRVPPHEIVGLGISQSPEGRMVFANLSVEDNVELGAYRRKDRAAIRADHFPIFLHRAFMPRRRSGVLVPTGSASSVVAPRVFPMGDGWHLSWAQSRVPCPGLDPCSSRS